MSANKHYMSDVIMGAAVGIASGRAVTIGVGGAQFDMGVSPTQGGAAVTFTKQRHEDHEGQEGHEGETGKSSVLLWPPVVFVFLRVLRVSSATR